MWEWGNPGWCLPCYHPSMASTRQRNGIFWGWWIVIGAVVGQLVGMGTGGSIIGAPATLLSRKPPSKIATVVARPLRDTPR